MANIKAAIKNIETTKRRTLANKSKKSAIKTYIKKFESAIDAGDVDEAKELLKAIDRQLKRAAHHNIVHKNAAARKISKLTQKLNSAM